MKSDLFSLAEKHLLCVLMVRVTDCSVTSYPSSQCQNARHVWLTDHLMDSHVNTNLRDLNMTVIWKYVLCRRRVGCQHSIADTSDMPTCCSALFNVQNASSTDFGFDSSQNRVQNGGQKRPNFLYCRGTQIPPTPFKDGRRGRGVEFTTSGRLILQ